MSNKLCAKNGIYILLPLQRLSLILNILVKILPDHTLQTEPFNFLRNSLMYSCILNIKDYHSAMTNMCLINTK